MSTNSSKHMHDPALRIKHLPYTELQNSVESIGNKDNKISRLFGEHSIIKRKMKQENNGEYFKSEANNSIKMNGSFYMTP